MNISFISTVKNTLHDHLTELTSIYEEAYKWVDDNSQGMSGYSEINAKLYKDLRMKFGLNSGLSQRLMSVVATNRRDGVDLLPETIIYCSKSVSFRKKQGVLTIWLPDGREVFPIPVEKKYILEQAVIKTGILQHIKDKVYKLTLRIDRPDTIYYTRPKSSGNKASSLT